MSSNYKYTRNWENQQKAIFDGVGEYDIPVIEPEEYHHVDWIPFNKAKTHTKTKGVGIHHFIDDYQGDDLTPAEKRMVKKYGNNLNKVFRFK